MQLKSNIPFSGRIFWSADVLYSDATTLVIEDRDECRSITNSAEHVIEHLRERDMLCPEVFYKDTDGVFDKITHDNKSYVAIVSCTDTERAHIATLIGSDVQPAGL